MWPPSTHVVVIIYYTYKMLYLFLELCGFILVIVSIILLMGLKTLRVAQKHKYSISVCLNDDFSIFHLSTFLFSLLNINYSFCAGSVKSLFVRIKGFSVYTWIKSNQWNKSFIYCWKIYDELGIPIGRSLYSYLPNRRTFMHKLLEFLLSWIW